MSSSYIKEKITPYPSVRLPKDPIDRQKFRSERVLSTRFLDNNFNVFLHKDKFWKPNGAFITKKHYESCDSGLTFYFERDGVISLPDVTPKEKIPYYHNHQRGGKTVKPNDDKPNIKPEMFPEFENIKGSERIVTIEFCSNCEDHQMHTDHSSESYYNAAKYFEKAIKLRFPAVKVVLKPIDTDIVKDFKQSFKAVSKKGNISEKFKPVKIGAFDIQIAVSPTEVEVIHSKLSNNQWPSLEKVLNSISKYVPRICFSFEVFYHNDKDLFDEGKELDSGKLRNIEIKIRRMKIPEIEQIKQEYAQEMNLVNNPKGRIKTLTTLNFMKSLDIKQPRPFTSCFYSKMNEITKRDENSTQRLWSSRTLIPSRDNSKKDHITNEALFYEKSKYEDLLGEVIENHFTDNTGNVKITNYLPYDSYAIEVVENKNFSGLCLISRISALQDVSVIKKSLYLKKQKNSFVTIITNTVDYSKEEPLLIQGCEIYIRRLTHKESEEDRLENEFHDSRTKVEENKDSPSKFSIILVPGFYMIEAFKEGFEKYTKEFEISAGENYLSVEMIKSKKSSLKVTVLKFGCERFSYIKNALVKLNYSFSDESIEGITNKEGTLIIDNIKEDDFYTVTAACEGYFTTQRKIVGKLNSDKENPKELVFIMVNKEAIKQENACIIVLSSNISLEDFECDFDLTNKIKDYLKIDQLALNKQGNICHYLNLNNEYEPEEDTEDFGEVLRIAYCIKNKKLLSLEEINKKTTLNKLAAFTNEITIYMPNQQFHIYAPQYSKDSDCLFWDVGFLDIKNMLFLEIGVLNNYKLNRLLFFTQWIQFIQSLINNKAYDSLFELFGFKDSILHYNDRILHEPQFFKYIKSFLQTSKSKDLEVSSTSNNRTSMISFEEDYTAEFLIYACDAFKTSRNMVSLSILKQKISSNLKNFKGK